MSSLTWYVPKGVATRSGFSRASSPTTSPSTSSSAGASVGEGHPGYLSLLDDLRFLHLEKSGGYGTGDDPFANFTAVAELSGEPRYLYAILRSIEKLTRCLSLHAQGRIEELREEFLDVAGLNLCAEAMRAEDRHPASREAA